MMEEPMPICIKPRPRVIVERALKTKPDARPAELARELGLDVDTVRGLIHLARKDTRPKARLIGADHVAGGAP